MSKYAISMLQSAEDMEKMQLEIDRLIAEVEKVERNAEYHADKNDELVAEVERLRGALQKIVEPETRDHYVECWRKAIAEKALRSD